MEPIGVLTPRGALKARDAVPKYVGTVEDIMCSDTISIDGRTPIWRAAGCAAHTGVRRFLIAEPESCGRTLVKIVSLLDLLSALSK